MTDVDTARLVQNIAGTDGGESLDVQYGVIASIDYTTNPWTVGVYVAGAATITEDIKTLNTYCPRVGETVVMVKAGADLWVQGSFGAENKPRCRINGVNLVGPGGSHDMVFSSEEADTDAMWEVGMPDQIFVNTPGVYELGAWTRHDDALSGRRFTQINLNVAFGQVGGHDISDIGAVGAGECEYTAVALPRWYNAGDYLKVAVFQGSAGNINIGVVFTAKWTGQFL